jgi:hypothetical protein
MSVSESMPIEKIHEFGFVLRVLQLLIVANIYNLLRSFHQKLEWQSCAGTELGARTGPWPAVA